MEVSLIMIYGCFSDPCVVVCVTEEITAAFRRFGPLVVDWPHKAESKSYFPPKGESFYPVCQGLPVWFYPSWSTPISSTLLNSNWSTSFFSGYTSLQQVVPCEDLCG